MHAVVGVLGEVLDLHAGGGDVVRLDAQNPLDDAVAFLSGLLACTCDELICGERIHLARQIRILTQSSAEV